MVDYLQHDTVWLSKHVYEDAETEYYENLARATATPLAGEVAKARQLLIESRDTFKDTLTSHTDIDVGALKFFEKRIVDFEKTFKDVIDRLSKLEARVSSVEQITKAAPQTHAIEFKKDFAKQSQKEEKDDDDGVDLFGSDSDEETDEAARVREERLAAYNAKKSKKPALVAKSNVILDVKPWDDETDMKVLEGEVRKIEADGLLWGASKLQPLAYGIHKLQISCVVEDDKVSIDWLTEQIETIEDYVQSVDIAAFNKI